MSPTYALGAQVYRIITDPYNGEEGVTMEHLIATFTETQPDTIDDVVWSLVASKLVICENEHFKAAPYDG